jgi:tetratricopeptide (TPR) repeat protein
MDKISSKKIVLPSPNPGDPIPFRTMSGDAFEEMCSSLLAREPGIRQADRYGRPRELQFGIDVIGEHEGGNSIDVISCKCRGQIRRGELAQWSDDFLNFLDSHWRSQNVRRFVLAVAADIKSSARRIEIEAEKGRFSALGLSYEIWPPRTLQEKIRQHPGIVAQFLGREWVPRICGLVESSNAYAAHFLGESPSLENAAHAASHVKLDQILSLLGQSTLTERAIQVAISRFIAFRPGANIHEIVEAISQFELGYQAIQKQFEAIHIVDNRIRSLKVKAEKALEAGDLDEALVAYRAAADAAKDKASEPVRNVAALKAAEASAHLLALDWKTANATWTLAEEMLKSFDAEGAEQIAIAAACDLEDFGRRFALQDAIDFAIQRWQKLLAGAISSQRIDKAAMAFNNLGNVTQLRGWWASGTEARVMFDKAIMAYEAALEFYGKDSHPYMWASIHGNIGNVIWRQAMHYSALDGVKLLLKSIENYDLSLEVLKKSQNPEEWSLCKINLGNAYLGVAQRVSGQASIAFLTLAVAAYKQAIRVRTKRAKPYEWAKTKHSIGIAFRLHGSRSEGKEALLLTRRAITACRSALTVRDRFSTPNDWGETQHCIGNAYLQLAGLSSNSEKVRWIALAIEAFESALTIFNHDNVPSHWVAIQCSLGCALLEQGQEMPRVTGLNLMNRALAIFDDALTVCRPDYFGHLHDTIVHNRGLAFALITKRGGA